MGLKKCPACGILNDDNWPIIIEAEIRDGGCQTCWEAQTDEAWWDMLDQLGRMGLCQCPHCGQLMHSTRTICRSCEMSMRSA